MRRRYFIGLSFRGTHYHGWQKQMNALTIQEVVEDSLYKISGERLRVVGSGRTDAGVHALSFIAHVDTEKELFREETDFLYKMNCVLPPDIALNDIRTVKPEAHARYSAISRTYEYVIRKHKDPFQNDLSWFHAQPLDVQAMNDAARKLILYNDFTSFSKLHGNAKTNICRIEKACWKESGRNLVFIIEADRFLRNMVRAIVGTLIGVGNGKITREDFTHIIESRDRSKALFSAPAQGLSLVHVKYPDDIYL
ncbi:MAG: tRNA pseudouridine(38-40) synthase TruA [Bacteroidales bacterium]|nr:tRNA pseudouridine(38-40) synthase TruA [Bacteroidales bacterium]